MKQNAAIFSFVVRKKGGNRDEVRNPETITNKLSMHCDK